MARRLADEPSPYLQQHQDNPVDWWPWSDAAFEEARRRDVPVFLSVGYATCHWCHVMAHESFEDDAVAALLNEHFVPVKVDREERPDVDAAYMAVCQAMTGRGGWPLTVLLAPDKRPWFAGTYFPRDSRGQVIGMLDLLPRLHEAWTDRRDEVLHSADHVVAALNQPPDRSGPRPDADVLSRATEQLKGRFDAAHGGFGDAPKFPSPHQIRFLLRRWHRTGDGDALHMVERSLDAMAQGGIHDHVGGGFHRYSTDPRWLVPHFEKMLYDQTTLLLAYTEAYQATGEERHKAMARDIIAYLVRDLRHPDGPFYAAEDADSEGEEGRFYVWTEDEVREALDGDADLFLRAYGVEGQGNFRDELTGQATGTNILHRPLSPTALADEEGMDPLELEARLATCREKLLTVRSARERPLRDEKVLADWNGLALAALARAAATFDDPDLLAEARTTAGGLLAMLLVDDRLRHRAKDDRVDEHAFLDDHAFLAWGLLELFQADGDPQWLQHARSLADAMLEDFARDDGALALSPRHGEILVVQPVEAYDGALPSGDSVAVGVLWRLARITGEPRYEEAAWRILEAFATDLDRMPAAFTEMLCGLDALLAGGQEVVVAGSGGPAEAMLRVARSDFAPDRVIVPHRGDGLVDQAPWLADYTAGGGGARAYVCRDHACQAPVEDPAALSAALAEGTQRDD